MTQLTRVVGLIILVTLATGLGADASGDDTWLAYTYRAGTFVPALRPAPARLPEQVACAPAGLPASWHVLAASEADLTGDGAVECALLVWRPWQDWPIMRWSSTPSPIAENRDIDGDSAHIILIDPATGRELWAGSALAVPIVRIATGDVDGDGAAELVALEGDYATGRNGPAQRVAVWRWNGFGFTLDWRSPRGQFDALALADLDGDGVAEVLTSVGRDL